MKMEMKMLVLCPCGTKLLVTMANYQKMRCPKCHLMLAEEIGRQAARNSRAIHDIAAIMLNDRMTAKRWTIHDEMICRVLARFEVESHGGPWPPLSETKEDDVTPIKLSYDQPVVQSPLHTMSDTAETGPAFPRDDPKKSIRVNLKKKRKGKK
jgi:hypothetical protein